MDHVKKMALVEPRVLETLRAAAGEASIARPAAPITAPVPPTVKALDTLDKAMAAVLQRTDLTDEEKIHAYQQNLQRYLTFQDQLHAPVTPITTNSSSSSTSTSNSAPPTATTAAPPGVEMDVLASLPTSLRKTGELLLRRIKQSSSMGWTPAGELTLGGQPLPGTHIVDLVNDALRQRRHPQAKGREAFARGLTALNVPREWVKNKALWTLATDQPATSSTAPTASSVWSEAADMTTPPTTPARERHRSPSASGWMTTRAFRTRQRGEKPRTPKTAWQGAWSNY